MAVNNKGQAMIETIFMLPFIIAMVMFMYQAYTLAHKVQVIQKYMKGAVMVRLFNRYETSVHEGGIPATEPHGKFFVYYKENDLGKMNYKIGDATKNLLFWFLFNAEHKEELIERVDSFYGDQMLGVCLGGAKGEDGLALLEDQVNPNIFENMSPNRTCMEK
jgi:hypothetical protein